MREVQISNLQEYIAETSKIFRARHASKVLFFRGLTDAAYKLSPGIFRLDYPESDFSHSFRAAAATAGDTPDYNDLDRWLFLMQHHGLPTRLLDWTESALVALHFAVHRNRSATDAAVVVLDPTLLNERILGSRWFPDRNDENYKYRFLKSFYRIPTRLPWDTGVNFDRIGEKNLPLAIRPIITHQRMVAQRSAFTIHGDDSRAIEEIFDEHDLSHLLLAFRIDAKRKRHIEVDLKNIGFTRSMVFPDLTGIAEDIVSRSRLEMSRES